MKLVAHAFACAGNLKVALHFQESVMFEALIKVGGSICNTQSLKALASQWAALASRRSLLFVAGGGLFADQVRALDKHLGLSDRAAHWMAIAAMEQNGYLLGDYMPGIPLISDFGFRISDFNSPSAVLLPYSLLRQADPLPHSWDATSDSLAAWLAGYSGARRLVLLKDVPGVYADGEPSANREVLAEISRSELVGYEAVDPYFVKALPPQMETWILSGDHPERLARLLETGETEGTRIMPEQQES
jgi:aspartokinase-like uncharacterized kinase